MNVPARSSTGEKLLRIPFGAGRKIVESEPQVREVDELKVARVPPSAQHHRIRRSAQVESELGQATYNCRCGFIFAAPVVTSVACPHCGDSQAW